MAGILTADEVLEVVRRTTMLVLPDLQPDEVTIEGTLNDLGANSIDRADIVTMSMEELGIIVPTTEFQNVRDIRTLVAVLRDHL